MPAKRLVFLLALVGPCSAYAFGSSLLFTRFTTNFDGGVNGLDTATGETTPIVPSGMRAAYRITADPVESKMYWTSTTNFGGASGGGIRRANLDGTGVELIVPFTGAPNFLSTAFNSENGKLLWSQNFQLRQSSPDGSNIQTLWSGAALVQDIALDTRHDKIYFSDFNGQGVGRLMRMDFDGSNVETVLDQIDDGPIGLGVDTVHERVYWARYDFGPSTGGISSANLDGSDIQELVSGVDVDALTLDSSSGTIYYTTINEAFTVGDIRRIGIDGSDPHIYDLGNMLPGGVVLIPEPGTLAVVLVTLPWLVRALSRRSV